MDEKLMQYIEALQSYDGNDTSVFLAGGITGCTNWQEELVTYLHNSPLVVFNPRRKHFCFQATAQEQISWEFTHLRKATAISFWFPKETLCPIVLYELGAWSMTDKKIFVGIDPEYQRFEDVHVQTALVRPDVHIVASVHALALQIQDWTTSYVSERPWTWPQKMESPNLEISSSIHHVPVQTRRDYILEG